MPSAWSRPLSCLLLTLVSACATSSAAGGGVPRSASDVDHDRVPDVDDHCPYDAGAGRDGCPVAAPDSGTPGSTIEVSASPTPAPPPPPPTGPTTPPAGPADPAAPR